MSAAVKNTLTGANCKPAKVGEKPINLRDGGRLHLNQDSADAHEQLRADNTHGVS